jgi:hypothetical protein
VDDLVDDKCMRRFVADQERDRARTAIAHVEEDGIIGAEAETGVMFAPDLKSIQVLSTAPINAEKNQYK